MNKSEEIEKLAVAIAEQVYLDVAKWHLYLDDAHLHLLLAEQFYTLVVAGKVTEAAVMQVLDSTMIKIGGRRDIPLADFIPAPVQLELIEILSKFEN